MLILELLCKMLFLGLTISSAFQISLFLIFKKSIVNYLVYIFGFSLAITIILFIY